jgi:hypothetical protein
VAAAQHHFAAAEFGIVRDVGDVGVEDVLVDLKQSVDIKLAVEHDIERDFGGRRSGGQHEEGGEQTGQAGHWGAGSRGRRRAEYVRRMSNR